MRASVLTLQQTRTDNVDASQSSAVATLPNFHMCDQRGMCPISGSPTSSRNKQWRFVTQKELAMNTERIRRNIMSGGGVIGVSEHAMSRSAHAAAVGGIEIVHVGGRLAKPEKAYRLW